MRIKLYIIALAVVTLTSCNSWLDVTPKGQVEASEMLSTEQGYNSALGGIYYTLSGSGMYGKELSYGMMDLLAQYWDMANKSYHDYYKLSQYDYKDMNSVSRFNTIWKGFYSVIAQCNVIIPSFEKNGASIRYSELMEGEAYGLRAFAHMELFRLFGPVIKSASDLEKPSIAYRTEFNTTAQKFETGKEVLLKVERDLLKALDLLANDPIKTAGRKGDLNDSYLIYHDVVNRRGSRMNYYAVLGLLARVEQLMLDQDQAYVYAKRVIDELKETKVIAFIEKSNIESETESWKDLNYSCEMLFSLYTNDLYEMTNKTFMMEGEGEMSSSFPINTSLYTTFMNEIYGRTPDGSGTDNRLRYWFEKQTGNTGSTESYYNLTKLRKVKEAMGLKPAYDPELPIMRLPEIYFIACEAQIGKDNDLALSYLNDLRVSRNLTRIAGPVSSSDLLEYMVRESRKDFIGEGRMFSLYKRLFLPIYVKQGVQVQPLENNFVFPIPDNEYEYSPNDKPEGN